MTMIFKRALAALLLVLCVLALFAGCADRRQTENDAPAVYLNDANSASDDLAEPVASKSGKQTSLKLACRDVISKVTHNESYNDLKKDLPITDPGTKSGKICLFYSRKDAPAAWNPDTNWNREHVWPKSKGWFTTGGAGADIHHIRPEDPDDNSQRGNTPFGEKSGYYNPPDNVKGDVARILFYMLVRYKETDSGYPVTKVAQSMEMLLRWNADDPVDESERYRNDAAYRIQGNRNPFIDCPELAFYLWSN